MLVALNAPKRVQNYHQELLIQLNTAPGFQASTELARSNLEKKSRAPTYVTERGPTFPLIYGYKSIPVRVCNECPPPRRNSERRESK